MVSKVAVMALVAVIAVPILLGYAMNLTEVTESDYRGTGDSVNVTNLLMNGTQFSTAHADLYQLNTNVRMGGILSLPLYENRTGTSTSLYSRILSNVAENTDYDMPDYHNWGMNVEDSTSSINLRMRIYKVVGGTESHYSNIDNVINASYDEKSKTVYYSYIQTSGSISVMKTGSYTNDYIRLKFVFNGGFDPTTNGAVMWGAPKSDDTSLYSGFVDFAAGFRILDHEQPVNQPYVYTEWPSGSVIFPQNTKSVLLTMDLDSITDANYSMLIGGPLYYLNKTTTGGVISWQIVDYYDPTYTIDLYYNQSGNNTYQIRIYSDPNGEPTGTPGYYDYTRHMEYRYVGAWPDIIGEADYYLTFDYTYVRIDTDFPDFTGLAMEASTTPIIRVDDAEFGAFSYQVIKDEEYDPAVYRSNPSTTIAAINNFGSSLTFGGNTYAVSKEGTITLSGHDIPVSNMILSSVPNGSGTYDNKIGNTVVSTTAAPSTIIFGGSWNASISTQSMESYTYTKTEWIPGEFAWDGIDTNFLIVGLITCLGAFVALGIYARKSRSGGIIPLMIVTGCAAMVFFIMI